MKKLIKFIPISLLSISLLSSCSLFGLDGKGKDGQSGGTNENQDKQEVINTILIDNVHYLIVDDHAEVAFFNDVEKIEIKEAIDVDGNSYPVTVIGNSNITNKQHYYGYSAGLPSFKTTEITIPSSVKVIKSFGLSFFEKLEKITIPDSVEKMEQGALYASNKIKEIHIPSFGSSHNLTADFEKYLQDNEISNIDIEETNKEDYEDNYGFDNFNQNDYLDEILCFDRLFSSPSGYDLNDRDFYHYTQIENADIYLTSGKYIFPYSFRGVGESTVHLCSSIDTVFHGAFSGSPISKRTTVDFASLDQYFSMKYEDLNSYIPRICQVTVNGSNELKDVVIPEHITHLYPYLISSFKGFESITLPSTLVDAYDLNNVYFGNASANYYKGGFYYGNENNPYLYLSYASSYEEEFEMHPDCKFISKNAFSDCAYLRKVTFNDKIREIPDSMFFEKPFLKEVNFEGECKLEVIGEGAFYRTSLTNFAFPKTLKRIKGQAFSQCVNLKNITWEEGLDGLEIEHRAFENCPLGESLILPDGISKIDYKAFNFDDNCKNISIYIPESVSPENLNENAFVFADSYYGSNEERSARFLFGGNVEDYAQFIDEYFSTYGAKEKNRYEISSLGNAIVYDNCVLVELDDGYCFEGLFAFRNYLTISNIPEEVNGKKIIALKFEFGDYSQCKWIKLNENCKTIYLTDETPKAIIFNKGVNTIINQTDRKIALYFNGSSSDLLVDPDTIGDIKIYFYSEEKPTTSGNYWHYNVGEPAVWPSVK